MTRLCLALTLALAACGRPFEPPPCASLPADTLVANDTIVVIWQVGECRP